MELTVLGRYGPYPRAGGACSGYLVSEGNTTLLVDCGPGVLSRLLSVTSLSDIDAVLLCHLHYDHCADVSVLRYALEQRSVLDGIRSPMPLYAPSEPADAHRLFEYPVFDIRPLTDGLCARFGALTVTFHAVEHPVPTFGMEFVSEGGKRLFYTGDTALFAALSGMCADADALLADTCFVDADDKGQKLVHMTARQVGGLAKSAGVGRLLCTHLWGGADTAETVKKEVDIPNATVVQELGHYWI